MFRHAGHILYSATDLVTFHECEHASALDRAALDDPQLRAERCAADETGQLVIERGHRFEATWLEERRRELTSEPRWPGDGPAVVEIAKDGLTLEARAAATLDAMRAGAELIYQATFLDEDLMGHAAFGRRASLVSATS